MSVSISQALAAPLHFAAFWPLAAAAPAPPPPAPGFDITMLWPMLLAAGVYFLFIAPQAKRQKEQAKLLETLKSGDEVVTSSGIYGVVTGVKPDRFVIEIAKGTRIEVRKANVEALTSAPAAEEPAKKS